MKTQLAFTTAPHPALTANGQTPDRGQDDAMNNLGKATRRTATASGEPHDAR